MAAANFSDYKFFQYETTEELYDAIEEEFPQLHIRNILSVDSAKAWCQSEGSVFPTPRWSGKAATVVNGRTIAMLLGDAVSSL